MLDLRVNDVIITEGVPYKVTFKYFDNVSNQWYIDFTALDGKKSIRALRLDELEVRFKEYSVEIIRDNSELLNILYS